MDAQDQSSPQGLRRIAVEIGGTFTDCVFEYEDGSLKTLKVPSTPSSPERSVRDALARIADRLDNAQEFLHGSTVATNAVIERKGARTAFATTRGFRDLLELQRGARNNIYDLQYVKPEPLVQREQAHEVHERTAADGSVLLPLDEERLERTAEVIGRAGAEAVSVTLLHSYANGGHERRVRDLLAERLPGVWIDISSEVAPEFREYERASTTTMSAYLGPRVSSYVGGLAADLRARRFEGTFLIMQSSGGVQRVNDGPVRPIEFLESGPVAGVTGASKVASRAGVGSLITFDMGGTSTDISVVDSGKLKYAAQSYLDGLPVRSPTVDIVSVGAGGSSIARVDEGRLLHVGPQSAGAEPGPACYGKGGKLPTVTDAHVLKGVIRPGSFIGGEFRLDEEAAERAVGEKIAGMLGVSIDDAAEAIIRVADENTVNAIRLVTMERGLDPRDYALFAYGGAGPLHAATVAQELGINEVIVPPSAGMISALGLLGAPLQRTRTATRIVQADRCDDREIQRLYENLEEGVSSELEEMGADRGDVRLYRTVEARYVGQAYELSVEVARPVDVGAIVSAFHDMHLERYSQSRTSEPVEFVSYRVRGEIERPFANLSDTIGGHAERSTGSILQGGERVEAVFVGRGALQTGEGLHGPAVVEETSSACYVPSGWIARVDEEANLRLTRGS
jgi:N-methylhydantoinase A